MAFIAMAREAYRKRRDLLLEGLSRIGLKAVRPSGAFYVLMDTSPFAPNEVEAAERLLVAGVAVVPGTDFAAFGHVRLSYATGEENLKKALERFAQALQ
jgi:aspartate aminotransferase